MKKIISFAIAALTLLSSLNIVSAAEVSTLTIGNVDASAVEVGGDIVVPISIDALPEGSVSGIQLDFTFDKTKMEFKFSDIYGLGEDDMAMQVWDASSSNSNRHKLADASWTPIEGDNLTLVNTNGAGSLLYVDTTKKKTFTTENSLAESDVLVYLYFAKLEGATGTCDVNFSEAKLVDVYSNTDGISYSKSAGQIKVVPGTVTFTAGPTKKVEVAGYFTGDKETDGDNADTTDTTAAIYAQLIPADADTVYTKVNWSVTATEDGTANSAAKTQEYEQTGLDLSGEATYKVGLVIRGLAANVITAVDAALAQ